MVSDWLVLTAISINLGDAYHQEPGSASWTLLLTRRYGFVTRRQIAFLGQFGLCRATRPS
jgi:hypothetical protein